MSVKTNIIMVGMRAGIQALNPSYVLGDPAIFDDNYVVTLSDPKTGESVPCIWSLVDEDKNDGEDLIDFIYAFTKNAVDSLSDLIEIKQTGELKSYSEQLLPKVDFGE